MTILLQEKEKNSGFSLLEIAIVLVIIGLLAGGVLVGKDLIKAAEIRATVSQYEKINTALNTFRSKYNEMPGDMQRKNAAAFGLCPAAGCPGADGTGFGNGDGILNDTNTTNVSAYIGEPLAFWLQLSMANMIADKLGSSLTNGYAIDVTADSKPGSYFQAAKIGKANYWTAGSGSDGQNYFMLMGVSALTTGVESQYYLTPLESFGLDSKIDDGKPNTGIVQARSFVATPIAVLSDLSATNVASFGTAPSTTNCITTSDPMNLNAVNASNIYAMYSVAGETPLCALRMRMMN